MTDNIETTASDVVASDVTPVVDVTTPEAATPSFAESISDPDLKAYVEKAGYKDINGVIKSAQHLEQKLGAPKEPETFKSEDYTYELPENYEANKDLLGSIQEKAVELGIKPEAFKDLVETFTGQEHEAIQKMQSDNEVEFQKELDEVADHFKEKNKLAANDMIEKSRNAWGSFVDPKYKDVFQNFDKGTQLVVADMLNNISSKVTEGTIGKQSTNGLTKSEAQSRLDAIQGDPSHKYWTGDSRERAELGQEVIRLSKLV